MSHVRRGAPTNSVHSPGSAASPLTGCHGGGWKGQGRHQGGLPGGFLPAALFPALAKSHESASRGSAFQSKAFALLGRLLKAAWLPLRPGDTAKGIFCSRVSMGTSSGSLGEAGASPRTLEAGPRGWAAGGSGPGSWEPHLGRDGGGEAAGKHGTAHGNQAQGLRNPAGWRDAFRGWSEDSLSFILSFLKNFYISGCTAVFETQIIPQV